MSFPTCLSYNSWFPSNRHVISRSNSVSFAHEYEVRFFKRVDSSTESKLWYSHQEYSDMKLANKQAGKHAQAFSRNSNTIQTSVCWQVLNTWSFHQALAGRTQQTANKAKLLQEVLERQGQYGPLRLSSLSQSYSESSARRARIIGFLQHNRKNVSSLKVDGSGHFMLGRICIV